MKAKKASEAVSLEQIPNIGKAIKSGAKGVSEPTEMPWGQMISYVRDCNGFLVEICSQVG